MSFAAVFGATQRGDYSPGNRLVLACIESHANGAGVWRMTDQDIANEMQLSSDTVSRGIAALEASGDLRAVRHKRRPTTFYLLRHREATPQPRHEPEIEARITAELTPHFAESSPELSPQIAESLYPTERVQQEGSESVAGATHAREPLPVVEILVEGQDDDGPMVQAIEAATVAPVEPSPVAAAVQAAPVVVPVEAVEAAPVVVPVEAVQAAPVVAPVEEVTAGPIVVRGGGKARKEARGSTTKASVPEDWEPTQADRLFAIQRGLDPDAVRLKFVFWHRGKGVRVADVSARFRCWCLDEVGRFAGKVTARQRQDQFNRETDEALIADGFLRPGETLVGFAWGPVP